MTTVISYLTAWPSRDVIRLAHQLISRDWWENQRNLFELQTSQLVILEAGAGDPTAAAERINALQGIPVLLITPPARGLAKSLATAMALPRKAEADALHLAIAAVHDVDFLLTWNCTHIANGNFIPIIRKVCEGEGFPSPQIVTPEQLMEKP